MELNKQVLLIVSISSLLLSFSAEAICVPKNTTHHIHSPSRRPSTQSPPHVSSLPRRPSTQSPPPASSPPSCPSTRSPLSVSSLPRLPAATHPTFSPAVTAICEKTDYPSLCISSLAPFLPNRNNPAAILEMAIKASVNSTTAALAKASRLSSDPSIPAIVKLRIADCEELYSDAVDNFNTAAQAIPSGDIGLMNSMLSAAISNFETCEDGFAEASELDSPFKEIESKLTRMTSNCLAIASLLR